MSAEIIPFPVRLPQAEDGQQRLRRAVMELEEAVATQRKAVAAWRESLAQLQVTMHGLGDSLVRYRDNLDNVGSLVASVNAEARALESWADDVLIRGGAAR